MVRDWVNYFFVMNWGYCQVLLFYIWDINVVLWAVFPKNFVIFYYFILFYFYLKNSNYQMKTGQLLAQFRWKANCCIISPSSISFAAALPYLMQSGNQKACALRVRCAASILLPALQKQLKAGRWKAKECRAKFIFASWWKSNLRKG